MDKQRPRLLAEVVELFPDGTILLIRCPRCGRENWAVSVYSGICAWCGFDGKTLIENKCNGDTCNKFEDKDA